MTGTQPRTATKGHRGRAWVSLVAAAAIGMSSTAPAFAATPASGVMSRAEYEACQARDDAGFRTAIEAITLKTLQAGVARIEMRAIVAEQWRAGGLDEIIDKRVDLATAEVRDETSWADRLKSLAYREKSQDLATAVAERVYRSDAMRAAIETLATGVGRSIGRSIELSAADAAEPARQCLQAFIGPRYGSTIARAVTQDTSTAFAIDSKDAAASISGGDMVRQSVGGITGVAVIVARRQMATMASRIGQRVVGSVLSRLVSVVAGGVGLILIAKDIWDFRNGVLPIISDEMKSRATKDKVQDEIAKAMSEQISAQMRDIATNATDQILTIWQQFRQAHDKVLRLAERNEPFKRFLNATPPARLAQLDEVVALIVAKHREQGVLDRLEGGQLQAAMTTLGDSGLEIARDLGSVDTALAWTALARERLGDVVGLGLHRTTAPDTITRVNLNRILDLGDRIASQRLASIKPTAREALLQLDNAEARSLARSLTEAELITLASYLTGLEREASNRVLRAIAQKPARMQALASDRVRDAIVASRDQLAAVAMMLRADALLEPTRFIDDAKNVIDGRISPVLIWVKHPAAVGGVALGGVFVLLMFARLFSGVRRPPPRAPQPLKSPQPRPTGAPPSPPSAHRPSRDRLPPGTGAGGGAGPATT